ncbi:MAG: DUF3536 domain-containing protein [Bacteroidales bacterium]|nr:DUF3536 domain-containing protein [Bacteroidales bacterium]MCF8386636.1 DUF3536 domain-containing protein [Bacteroidales bacterium]MCF8398928.1 DUF3536 domain-containing protein [Bacteroidales bacterium]
MEGTEMEKYICIHGHFYQPPREDPWTEKIEEQKDAAPFHDWNERITYECYEPNTSSRILEEERIVDVVNNFEKISFNFGPTLFTWLSRKHPETYRKIIDADKISADKNEGYGSAIAQAYNHMIMPLANHKDKETQVYWGIRDFEFRFKRKPLGMWLPETAVDTATLEELAKQEIRFTILSPEQAGAVRKSGSDSWIKVNTNSLDKSRPYCCKLPSGRSIILFFYNGKVSHDVAFNGLLKDGKMFADHLLEAFDNNNIGLELSHIATDGETYGHHHRHGDMALAFCLYYIEKYKKARLSNYAFFLNMKPADHEVQIRENTSWSCSHGIERWRSNCGCKGTNESHIHQKWRKPLRDAFDFLRDDIDNIFVVQMKKLTHADPWDLRNKYISVILDRSEENILEFLKKYAGIETGREEMIRMLELLEMQKHAMFMYTSCAWFFDDISDTGTVQIIAYATRACQLAEKFTKRKLFPAFLTKLAKAKGNFRDYPDARVLFEKLVKPRIIDIDVFAL